MKLTEVKVDEIRPYENNPRLNDKAVDAVVESVRQCGYISPIIVDENMVVLAGHTRLKAIKRLGWKDVKVAIADGLSDEQKRKYRILDNKTNEFSEWDLDALEKELEGLDFDGFDFGFFDEDAPEEKEREDVNIEDGEYQIIVDCENESDMESKYNMIVELGIECRTSTL